MSWIKSERIEFINEYERKYGVRLSENDEMLPILHFIFDAGKLTTQRLNDTSTLINRAEKIINEAASKMNSKVYHFKEGDAFKWQIGIAFKVILIMGSIILTGWSIYYWIDAYKMKKKSEAIIRAVPFIENVNVRVNQEGYHFIEFLPPKQKSKVQFYTDYELQKDGTIRIYIGKE